MLADTNLIIYSVKPAYAFMREWFEKETPAVSAVSYVEALGFPGIKPDEERALKEFFGGTNVLPLDNAVLKQAVKLRQTKKMGLGDALVAGTALAHGLTLATHNEEDFQWISDLSLFDPFKPKPTAQPEEDA